MLKRRLFAANKAARFCCSVLFIACITIAGCAERHRIRTTPQMDAPAQFWVRVLLLDDVQSCKIKINRPFTVTDSQTYSVIGTFKKFSTPAPVTLSGSKIRFAGKEFTAPQITLLPAKPHVFNVDGSDYRGKLKLIRNPDGKSFDVINIVPLEPYLAGVVGAEMPDYWQSQALQAQAIAARTYCLYIKKRFGKKRSWDLTKTTANQVYRGLKAESKSIWKAVEKTHGQVLLCNQDGLNKIFPAYYSSICGGHTENSKNVFGDSYETLTGVPCPYCKDIAKPQIFFWPMVQFSKTDITEKLSKKYPKLKQLTTVARIEPHKKSEYGDFSRLTMVKISDATGKNAFLRAEDMRLTIDPTGSKIKSTICRIANIGDNIAFLLGRGYGHSVGMCQYGAQGMARKGKTAQQILTYYYPNSKNVRIY